MSSQMNNAVSSSSSVRSVFGLRFTRGHRTQQQPSLEPAQKIHIYNPLGTDFVPPLAMVRKMRALASENLVHAILDNFKKAYEQGGWERAFALLKKQKLDIILPCVVQHGNPFLFSAPFSAEEPQLTIEYFNAALATYNKENGTNLQIALTAEDISHFAGEQHAHAIEMAGFVFRISEDHLSIDVSKSQNPFHFHEQALISEADKAIFSMLKNRTVIVEDPIRCNFKVVQTDSGHKVVAFYSTKSPEAVANTYLSAFGQVDFVKDYLMQFPNTDFSEVERDPNAKKSLRSLFDSFYSCLKANSCALMNMGGSSGDYVVAVEWFLKTQHARKLMGLFKKLKTVLKDKRRERAKKTIEQFGSFFLAYGSAITQPCYISEFGNQKSLSNEQKSVLTRLFATAEALRCSTALHHDNPYEMLNSAYLLLYAKLSKEEQKQKSGEQNRFSEYKAHIGKVAGLLNAFSNDYIRYLDLVKVAISSPSDGSAQRLLNLKLALFKTFVCFKECIDDALSSNLITADEHVSLLGILMYMRATFFDLDSNLVEAAKLKLFSKESLSQSSNKEPTNNSLGKQMREFTSLMSLYSEYLGYKSKSTEQEFVSWLQTAKGRKQDRNRIRSVIALESEIDSRTSDRFNFLGLVKQSLAAEETDVFTESKKIMSSIASTIMATAVPADLQSMAAVKTMLKLWLVTLTSHGMYKAKLYPPKDLRSLLYNPHLAFMAKTILIEDEYLRTGNGEVRKAHGRNLAIMREFESETNKEEWITRVFGVPVIDLTQPLNYEYDLGLPFEKTLEIGSNNKRQTRKPETQIKFSGAYEHICNANMSGIQFSDYSEPQSSLNEIIVGQPAENKAARKFYDSPRGVDFMQLIGAINSFVLSTKFHRTIGSESHWNASQYPFWKRIRQRFINGTLVLDCAPDRGVSRDLSIRPKIMEENTRIQEETVRTMEAIIGALFSSTVKNWIVIDSMLGFLENDH